MEPFQYSLLHPPPRPATPPAGGAEQESQLARVTSRIGVAVLAFCRARVGRTFHAAELHEAVGGAPASADRVMRELRRLGHLDVQVEDRAASLYRVVFVQEATDG